MSDTTKTLILLHEPIKPHVLEILKKEFVGLKTVWVKHCKSGKEIFNKLKAKRMHIRSLYTNSMWGNQLEDEDEIIDYLDGVAKKTDNAVICIYE